jgi:CHAD domain-containing protein
MRAGPALRRAFATRHRALNKQLTEALGGDGHAVHQARVATRRLREALPVIGAALGRKRVRKLRKRLRKLTRLFGAVRERDVALAMIDRHQTDGSVETAAADRVRAVVHEGRNAARHRLLAGLDAHKVARWLDDVTTFEQELKASVETAGSSQARLPAPGRQGKGQGDGLPAWRIALARRLLTRTERLRRAITDAGMLFVPERLHVVRIALKRLRYAVELAGELSGRKLDATLDELKRCQDTLGTLHDLDMLMSYVESTLEGEIEPHVRASLVTLQTKLEAERHQLHARYLAEQPSLLTLIDRVQDQIVPRFQMAKAAPRPRASRRQLPQHLRRQEPGERAGTGVRR